MKRLLAVVALLAVFAAAVFVVTNSRSSADGGGAPKSSAPKKRPVAPPRRRTPATGAEVPKGSAAIEGIVRAAGRPMVALVEVQRLGDPGAGEPALRTGRARELADYVRFPELAAPVLWTADAADDGAFRVAGLPAGAYRMTAVLADGRTASRVADVPADGDVVHADIDVAAGAGSIAGRAVHGDGSAFDGWIGVSIQLGPDDATGWTPAAKDGSFSISGIDAPQVRLVAARPGEFFALSVRVTLPAKDFVFKVDGLRDERRARVTSAADHSPIAGARVAWMSRGDSDTSNIHIAHSAKDGTFRVASDVRLARVTADGFAPGDGTDDGKGDEFVIELEPCGSVSGRVVSADGKPVANVPVYASVGDQKSPRAAVTTKSGADGAYRLDGVGPGDATVYALGGGWCSVGLAEIQEKGANPLHVSVPPGGATTLDLVVEKSGRAIVHAVDDASAPVAGAHVFGWTNPDRGAPPVNLRTAADGAATVENLIPGAEYFLHAQTPGGPKVNLPVLRAASGATTEVTVKLPAPRYVVVTVTDAATQAPLAGAVVRAAHVEGRSTSTLNGTWTTGADGTVRAGPLDADANAFAASANGHRPTEKPELVPPGTNPALAISLARGAVVAGTVVWPQGSEPTDVTVTIHGSSDEPLSLPEHDFQIVSSDGRFRFDSLRGGTYEVNAQSRGEGGQLFAHATVGTDAESLLLTLAKPGPDSGATSFEVHVVDAAGDDVPGGALTFISMRGHGSGGSTGATLSGGRRSLGMPQKGERCYVAVSRPTGFLKRRLALGGRVVAISDTPGPEVRIELAAEVPLVGRVVGPDGQPVRGVLVEALSTSDDFKLFGGQLVFGEDTSNGDGAFRVGQLGGGEWVLRVSAPSSFAPVAPIVATAGGAPVTITLRSSAPAVVTVLADDGRPLAGMSVRTYVAGKGDTTTVAPKATSDAAGAARIGGLDPALAYVLEVGPPSGRDDYLVARRDAWTPADTTIRLERGFAVAGVVQDADGQPVPGALVLRKRKDGFGGSGVGDDARFRISGLRAGEELDLAAQLPSSSRGPGHEPRWTRVRAGDEHVVLALAGVALRVKCDDAAMLRSGLVEIVADGRVVASDDFLGTIDGNLRFGELDAARTYTVWAPPLPDGRYGLLRGVAPGPDVHVVKLVQGERTTGRVTGPAGARVAKIPVVASQDGMRVHATTDADGMFDFPGLPRGTWRLTADASERGEPGWHGEADVTAGGNAQIELARK